MNVPDGFLDDLKRRSRQIVRKLKDHPTLGPYIDDNLDVPDSYVGRGPIKLVIIGQDPTIGDAKRRREITQALMLNSEKNNLTRFLREVCSRLGLSLEDNVYARNLCKGFFTVPPSRLKSPRLVLEAGKEWLPVLLDELGLFPDATVLTLGEPVLDVFLPGDQHRPMRWFWGYHANWRDGKFSPFRHAEGPTSHLKRAFYPFIHLNSRSRGFYKTQFDGYLTFIPKRIEATGSLSHDNGLDSRSPEQPDRIDPPPVAR